MAAVAAAAHGGWTWHCSPSADGSTAQRTDSGDGGSVQDGRQLRSAVVDGGCSGGGLAD
jgi:hypothetical protein